MEVFVVGMSHRKGGSQAWRMAEMVKHTEPFSR